MEAAERLAGWNLAKKLVSKTKSSQIINDAIAY